MSLFKKNLNPNNSNKFTSLTKVFVLSPPRQSFLLNCCAKYISFLFC